MNISGLPFDGIPLRPKSTWSKEEWQWYKECWWYYRLAASITIRLPFLYWPLVLTAEFVDYFEAPTIGLGHKTGAPPPPPDSEARKDQHDGPWGGARPAGVDSSRPGSDAR